MRKIIRESFCSWPYDQALIWMDDAHERVVKDAKSIIIGCGSHSKKIITLGRNVAYSQNDFHNWQQSVNCEVFQLDRGGGITAHEPGQMVLYPILNLKEHGLSVRDLIHLGEEAIITFMSYFGVKGERLKSQTGIYIGYTKVGFIGMRIKDGISTHGLAINVLNDARIFRYFVPCGIPDLAVTSLYRHAEIQESMSACIEKLSQSYKDCLSMLSGHKF